MSARVPGRSERKAWHLRAASSPAKPVALDGRSARGLLSMLEGRDEPGCVEAREALTNALAGGGPEAIRGAMDAARRVLPAPAMTRAEVVEAELAETLAATQPSAQPGRPQRPARPLPPTPAEVLAALDGVLAGELSRSARWNLEQHRRDLARVMGNGAKSLYEFARRAERALEEHRHTIERARIEAHKRAAKAANETPAA